MSDELNEFEIAKLEYVAGRYGHAAQFAQYWIARYPDDSDALQLFGLACIYRGIYAPGIDALEYAALLVPLAADAQIGLATAYGAVGRRELSKDLLMSAATSGSRSGQELLDIAAGLEGIDEPFLAMEACRQAGLVMSDSPEVHYQMGYLASRCEYPTSVIEALIRHAISLDPNNLHYRIGLASLLVRLNRKPEAFEVIAPLIPDQLPNVSCRCCLKRIANLFFDCDDFDLANQCVCRLKELDAEHSSHQVTN